MVVASKSGHKFPDAHEGIQVNFCKTVGCRSFGVPETPHRGRRAPGVPAEPGEYSRHGHLEGTLMKCACCGSHPPVRSNKGIFEELARISANTTPPVERCCVTPECKNASIPLGTKGAYVKFGKTAAGSSRWRCKECGKTLTGDSPSTIKQRVTHLNQDIFKLLVNKSPINRICGFTGLHPKVVYGKIDFIHRQCLAFAGGRERKLLEGMVLPKMYIAVDRQMHTVNWNSRKDRRNIILNAIASADLESGYIFGFHLNFDPHMDPTLVEDEALKAGDLGKDEAARHFARLWLNADFRDTALKAAAQKAKIPTSPKARADPLSGEITGVYDEAAERLDIEATALSATDTTLPKLGMMVKEQYTMHAHFQYLASLLKGAPKVRIYMDQDSGIRAAFLGAFVDRIKERTADGWFISILKETTIHDKERAVQAARKRLEAVQASIPGMDPYDALLILMKEQMRIGAQVGPFADKWVSHPQPNMSEPEKRLCWLTDMGDYDENHAAHLYLKGSLHAVDRFFMQARRFLSMGERSIATVSKGPRIWNVYSAYRPENLARALEIFRVYYNFCKPGKDKKTPAMRLGLARAVVPLEDVLYF